DGRVLLAARLQSPVARIRGHCCIGIGRAKLLVLSALPAFSLDLRSLLGLVLAQHILHVPSARLSQLTLARMSEASICTTSAVAIFAVRQASTVRLKILRNRSSPQRWRMRVRLE